MVTRTPNRWVTDWDAVREAAEIRDREEAASDAAREIREQIREGFIAGRRVA